MKLTQLFEKFIIKGEGVRSYPELIYSVNELKDLLKEHYGSSKITIINIAKLYAEHNYKLRDDITKFSFPVKEIDLYKEWNRPINDDLMDMIKKDGIRDYGVIGLYKKKNGEVRIILNEGNHRLAIAKKLGIKEMLINIYFGRD